MNKKKIIMIAVAALLMLGAGLGGGYYLTTSGMLGGEASEDAAPPPETLGVLELEPFLTNIGASGKRHARVTIKLAVSPEERSAEVGADSLAVARLRDLILTLLTSKSFEELASPEGKAALRKEIIDQSAPVIEPGKVREVLFGEFVVQ